MLVPIDRISTPPGGHDSLQADGTLIKGNTRSQLLELVLRYRIEHGLPIANLAEEVDDEMCRRKPMRCAPPRPVPGGSVRQIGVADVWRWLVTIAAWIVNGTFVPQEEAELRAETCSGCKEQCDPIGCWGCSGLFALIFKAIGNRTTKMDANLRSCGICACENKVAAFVPLDILKRASGDLDYPEDTTGNGGPPCWRRADA